ncbi:DNA adenine methylase [Anaerolineae bacterium CFX9]|nr:DNA adenine methylase [Anaerolineae bacterium CFX9]
MTRSYKSPLRYPGGKSRAIHQILRRIPANMREYREPFVGGGSVYFAIRERFGKSLLYTINDLNRDLYCFWLYVRDDLDLLADTVQSFHTQYSGRGRELYEFLTDEANMRSDFDRAVRFFIMNRITFSGVMDAGGYSQLAFEQRFTQSSIDRLRALQSLLSSVTICNKDYESIVLQEGEQVFIFLDPPYYSATQSRLYGVRGALHTAFDHERFAHVMRKCPHRWLITYDDSPFIRELFDFAHIEEWELQYGMNNFRQENAQKGKELFISNYR